MKLVSIIIKNNVVLGDVSLSFIDPKGNVYDNIIFAGENGCGKTTLLNIISDGGSNRDLSIGEERTLTFLLSEKESIGLIGNNNLQGNKTQFVLEYFCTRIDANNARFITRLYRDFKKQESIGSGYVLNKIVYLTPEIQFNSRDIENVTAQELDTYNSNSIKISTHNDAHDIIQLIVDISNQDALDFSRLYSENPSGSYGQSEIRPRVERFNNAFKYILDGFVIDGVKNENRRKSVVFLNRGKKVPIDKLSSGEKQLIFRGGFLLRDKNSLNGVIVLIDEPEISLHPEWQKKIVGFYRNILSDSTGKQTSQLFLATHSPFIVHNEDRVNDKVFVLRKEKGKVIIMDKPEYYLVDSPSVVNDAFNVNFIEEENETAFLEGMIDEKYFNKTIQVYDLLTKFKYRWIGYVDASGNDKNTGYKALDHARDYLVARNSGNHYILFYDCDTNKTKTIENGVATLCAPSFPPSKGMNKGIENALLLEDIDISGFYRFKTINQDYGGECTKKELDKMALCNYVCNLDDATAKKVLKNIKSFIDDIETTFQ